MPYLTRADLVTRFSELELIQLTDRAGLGAADEAVIAQAMADAEAKIDGYLAGRYSLPLAAVPAILVGYACDITRLLLYKDAAPDMVVSRADEALKFLALVAQGKISLGVQPEPETVATGGVSFVQGGRVFGDEVLS